jgi:flagellar basal-body rod modification protein FlgD
MTSLLAPDTFLNLLVDELKYQDPLDPTSSTDFLNQIAELSQVEQLQTVSSSSQITEAAFLMGETVTGNDTNGTLISGVVTGITNGTNGPTLDVGGQIIDLSSIIEIGSLAPPTTGTGTSTSTSTS